MTNEKLEAARTGNWFLEHDLVIARLDKLARNEDAQAKLAVPDGRLPAEWDPTTDARLTVWEIVHHLIRGLEEGGESAAAGLVKKLGSNAEVARELAYRLYTLCERKKRAAEALSYNGLVQSWPEILRLAHEDKTVADQPKIPGTE